MEMPTAETLICHCHGKTLGEIAGYIKTHGTQRWEDIVNDTSFACGDTCQKCHLDGYENDGLSLAMAVGMVKRGYI